MCDKIATSREHVPPQCLFPESKDVKGLNFRKELITVPSCEDHNLKKSKDDEFLMITIAGIIDNNFLGYYHTKTKVSRALVRKSKDYLNNQIVKNYKKQEIKLDDGKNYPVLKGQFDFDRLYECFEHISYGLYYRKFKKRFNGEIRMIFGFMKPEDNNTITMIKFIRKRFEIEDGLLDKEGANQDVFNYQFCKPDENGLIAMKMIFYGGTDVFVSYFPEYTDEPFNLAFELMKSGTNTTFDLNGEKFEFNKK